MHDYVGPPLNRQRLASVLAANGIAERAYHLYGAHPEDALVLDQRPQGWVIFYSERGEENIRSTHASEAEACLELLNCLLDDPWNCFELVAGPALPAEADSEFVAWLRAHGLTRDDLDDENVRMQDTPWKVGEPDYRRLDPDQDLAFSEQRLRYAVLRARLADRNGDAESAARFADAALIEAERTQPDYARHPNLGSASTDTVTHREMRRLAGRD